MSRRGTRYSGEAWSDQRGLLHSDRPLGIAPLPPLEALALYIYCALVIAAVMYVALRP